VLGERGADKFFELEFYDDPTTGRAPVYEWITNDLNPYQRRAIGTAMSLILQQFGKDVCEGEYGKNLGGGLYEFRLRHDADEIVAKFAPDKQPDNDEDQGPVLLRVFFHPHGNRLLLLLAGYDKSKDASDKREDKEIALARKRLTEFKGRKSGG